MVVSARDRGEISQPPGEACPPERAQRIPPSSLLSCPSSFLPVFREQLLGPETGCLSEVEAEYGRVTSHVILHRDKRLG